MREGNLVRSVTEDAVVLRLKDEKPYVCADYGEFLVYASDGSVTPKVGLNIPYVTECLRRAAFPPQLAGAAYLRWPEKEPMPGCIQTLPAGVLVFSRQTMQMDRSGVWTETKAALHVYSYGQAGMVEVIGADKGKLLRGILQGIIRKSAEINDSILAGLRQAEGDLMLRLRRPTDDELAAQIRHAVMPLLAAVITE